MTIGKKQHMRSKKKGLNVEVQDNRHDKGCGGHPIGELGNRKSNRQIC
jgi:hypothetical protein